MERGKFFVVQSPLMPEGQFDLYSTNHEMQNNCVVPSRMTTKYVTTDADLGDAFVSIGIALAEMTKGRHAVLFVAPNTEVKFE